MEPFSIGVVVASGTRLGLRCLVRLAPAIVLLFGPLIAAVATGARIWMSFALLLEAPVAAMVSHAVIAELRGARPTARASIGVGLRRGLPVLGLMVTVSMVAAALGIAMLLPALGASDRYITGLPILIMLLIWLGIVVLLYSRWFVAIPALVFEDITVGKALSRSTALTTGRRKELAALLVVLAAMFVGGSLVVELCLRVRWSRWFFDPNASPALAAAGLVLWVVIAVLRASFAAVAYHHLRQDAEGASPEVLDRVFS